MEYLWAEKYSDLYKTLKLFRPKHLANPIKYKYTPFESLLQDGPQCGLVALATCTSGNQNDNLKSIFEYAKQQGFTYNGEIFSVQYMADLAKKFLKNSIINIYEGNVNSEKIKDFLLEGGLILIPYDTDKDNTPGLHNGHKAHWALISGGIETTGDFFVTARHGKQRLVAVWNLERLSQSNMQLFEFSPSRTLHEISYKLPEGGINGPMGLNKKSVLVQFVQSNIF